MADIMIAGGSEATLCSIGMASFAAARALSTRNDEPERASRPWDKDRDGFVLSDGAGVLVLEDYEHARKRIVVRLTGQTPVAPEAHSVAGDTLQVVFEPGATHSFAQLNQAMTEGASRIAAALPTAHARYVDERSGAIVIAVAPEASDDKAKEAELTRSLGVPVRIESEAPAVLQRPPAQR